MKKTMIAILAALTMVGSAYSYEYITTQWNTPGTNAWHTSGDWADIINTNFINTVTSNSNVGARIDAVVVTNAVQDAKIDTNSWNIATNIYSKPSGGKYAPLDITTFDDDPSLTHLDVLHVPLGWEQYSYWMTFTPFPPPGRELVSVVASRDMVNWEVPTWYTNPIITSAQVTALGYGWCADPCIVITSNNLLRAYYGLFTSSASNAVFCQTLTNRFSDWSNPVKVLHLDSSEGQASPCVLWDADDNIYKMWVQDWKNSTKADKLRLRSSNDGLSWGSAVTCVIPTNSQDSFGLWHMDIEKANGKYHMLLIPGTGQIEEDLYYWHSSDGTNWAGDLTTTAIRRSGDDWDAGGYYRSAFVPRPGNPQAFDVWLSGIPSAASTTNSTPAWLAGIYMGVDLTQRGYNYLSLDEYFTLLDRTFTFSMHADLWDTDEQTGSGSVLADTSEVGLSLSSGTTSNSYQCAAVPPQPGRSATPWSQANNDTHTMTWDTRMRVNGSVAATSMGTGAEALIHFGTTFSYEAAPTDKGVLLWMQNGSMKLIAHNGTAATTNTVGTYSSDDLIRYVIESDGSGNVSATATGLDSGGTAAIVGGGPTGAGTQYFNRLRLTARNVDSATDSVVVFGPITITAMDL